MRERVATSHFGCAFFLPPLQEHAMRSGKKRLVCAGGTVRRGVNDGEDSVAFSMPLPEACIHGVLVHTAYSLDLVIVVRRREERAHTTRKQVATRLLCGWWRTTR